jgi:hypothetical protein
MYLLPMLTVFLDIFTARKWSDLRDVSEERTPSIFSAESFEDLESSAKQSTPHTLQLSNSRLNINTESTLKYQINVLIVFVGFSEKRFAITFCKHQ